MERTKYYSGIKRYIVSRVTNPDDAEDLAQSVFLEFYRSNNRVDNPEAYLWGISRNLVANYYRQKNKQPGFLRLNAKIADKVAFEDYNSSSKTEYLVEEIETIVFELPSKAREAVELRLINNLSYKEAAYKANCSVDAFCERFYEGIKKIKKIARSNSLKKKDLYKKT